jgi:hypothetical protein
MLANTMTTATIINPLYVMFQSFRFDCSMAALCGDTGCIATWQNGKGRKKLRGQVADSEMRDQTDDDQ